MLPSACWASLRCPLPDQRLEENQQCLDEHRWVHNVQRFDVLLVPAKGSRVRKSCASGGELGISRSSKLQMSPWCSKSHAPNPQCTMPLLGAPCVIPILQPSVSPFSPHFLALTHPQPQPLLFANPQLHWGGTVSGGDELPRSLDTRTDSCLR